MTPTRTTARLAVCAGLLTVVGTYAALRVVQLSLFPEPNPALVIAAMRIAMFWRVGIGLYLGLVVGLLVAFAGDDRAERWTLRAVTPVALFALAQALLFP